MGDGSKRRLFAAGIDNLAALLLAMLPAAKIPGLPGTVRWVLAVCLYFGYFLVAEALFRTTPGKYLFGLWIERLDGGPVGWREAILRTALRIVEVNPLVGGLPAGLMIAFTKKRQRLGDLLASTVVSRRASQAEGHAIEHVA